MNPKILCKVCNERRLTRKHLMEVHRLTDEEYYCKYVLKAEHPKCECGNELHLETLSTGFRKFCSVSCSQKHYMTSERARSYAEKQWKKPEFVQMMSRTMHKTVISPGFKEARAKGLAKVKLRPEYRAKVSQIMLKKWSDDDFKDKRLSSIFKSHGKDKFYDSPKVGKVSYRSSYELEAYKMLDASDKVKKYEVECVRLKYRDSEGARRSYYPDLIITWKDNSREMIEIKPEKLLDHDIVIRKAESGRKYCEENGMTYSFWTEKELFYGGLKNVL
jgi:hypothetical protein